MKSLVFSFILAMLVIPNKGFSQSLNTNEICDLQNFVLSYLEKKDKIPSYDNSHRPVEYIQCYLDIDKDGKISNIQLLADNENKDSTFFCLSRMKPGDFGNWKAEKCKGKTILLPVLSLANGKRPVYITNMMPLYAERQYKIAYEKNQLIALEVLRYIAPARIEIKEEIPDKPIKVVDMVKLNNE